MNRQRSFRIGLAAVGLFVFACNGIIGIEDLHEEPRPGSGGAGNGKGGTGGSGDGGNSGRGGGAQGGKAPTGDGGAANGEGGVGAGGEAGHAGEPGGTGPGTGGTGTGGTGAGGAATGGKAATGGSAGAGGEGGFGGDGGAGPADTTVQGKVIDALGLPVPNATVFVGDASATTDASGIFAFANAPTSYDVSLIVNPGVGGGTGSYAWVFQGLTRRDPTLQVYAGLPSHSVDAHVTLSNSAFGEMFHTRIGFASPHGASEIGPTSPDYTSLGAIGWYGPSSTTGSIHALRWTTTATAFPTSYQAYYQTSLTVTDPTTAQIPITFPATAVTSGTVSGTVTSPSSDFRRTFAWVHFTSNAKIALVEDWDATTSFSYVMPVLANSVITVAAAEGPGAPYALAHRSVAAGTTGVALAIPSPSTLVAPGPGVTGVNGTTQFRWTGSSAVSVFHAESDNYFNGVYIVTSAKQATLPAVALGNMISNEPYYWMVETHGSWTSVDQAAGPGGFQDSFGWRGEPVGASRAAGTYTNSEARGFTPQ